MNPLVKISLLAFALGALAQAATPSITAVQNNYSFILPGLPNYGIAPGSIFIVTGANLNNQPLSSLQSSASPGVPLTLSGTSISVTVNGTTTQPALYYTSPSQLAAVLPSTTPVGTGTITVTNSGTPSAPAPIQVVASAMGLDTLYGTGAGQGVAEDPGFNFLGPTNSASPGEVINFWGSGVGGDTANDDRTYPQRQDNLTSIPMQVYIGGIAANISYRGRSQYPGVDQIQVTVPASVTPGCFVSVVAVSGTVVSNSVTIPVAAGGGACSDTDARVSLSATQTLSAKSTVNFGELTLLQETFAGVGGSSPSTSYVAAAEFQSASGVGFNLVANTNSVSLGGCIDNAATLPNSTGPTLGALNAGTITVTGPTGSQVLPATSAGSGIYEANLASGFIPAAGGNFSFSGTSGAAVGSFNTSLTFPPPVTWTNVGASSNVTRSAGLSMTWTGGASGSYVVIGGVSTGNISGQQISVSFTCAAPASAGQFTVPAYILQAMPAGGGSLGIDNFGNPQIFTATGLDLGFGFTGSSFSITATFN